MANLRISNSTENLQGSESFNDSEYFQEKNNSKNIDTPKDSELNENLEDKRDPRLFDEIIEDNEEEVIKDIVFRKIFTRMDMDSINEIFFDDDPIRINKTID